MDHQAWADRNDADEVMVLLSSLSKVISRVEKADVSPR
jgi:hypothetical protein